MGEFDEFEPVGSGGVFVGDSWLSGASCGNGPIGDLLCCSARCAEHIQRSCARYPRVLRHILIDSLRGFAQLFANTCGNCRMMLDETDNRLLAALQKDAHLTAAGAGRAAEPVAQPGRAPAAAAGGRRAISTATPPGSTPTGWACTCRPSCRCRWPRTSPTRSRSFARLVAPRPEIVSAWTMTGEADYLLRVYCTDLRRS